MIISVITPVYRGGDHYIRETRDCLAAQVLPPGWSLEWVLQEDGQTGLLDQYPDEPWISKGAGRQGGAARTRTVALTRAQGQLMRTLDADDLLPDPHALGRDITVLTDQPGFSWCVSPCLDLYEDGSLHPGPSDPASGPLPPGALLDGHRDGALPVMGTTMTAHTDLVRAVGSWPALPAYEDAALLLACEAVSLGWMQDRPGELYRKHGEQQTAHSDYRDQEERAVRLLAAQQQAEALERAGWRWTPSSLTHP